MRHTLWLLALLPGITLAQVYSYRDASGALMFSDRPPHDGAQPLAPRPINRMPALSAPAAPTTTPNLVRTQQRSPYRHLAILSPRPDAAHPDVSGDLRVELGSEPPLLPGHAYRLMLDGQPQSGLQLRNLDRGSHQLVAQIIDETERVLAASAEQIVHIQRPSLINKRRLRPCAADGEDRERPECDPRHLPPTKPAP